MSSITSRTTIQQSAKAPAPIRPRTARVRATTTMVESPFRTASSPNTKSAAMAASSKAIAVLYQKVTFILRMGVGDHLPMAAKRRYRGSAAIFPANT